MIGIIIGLMVFVLVVSFLELILEPNIAKEMNEMSQEMDIKFIETTISNIIYHDYLDRDNLIFEIGMIREEIYIDFYFYNQYGEKLDGDLQIKTNLNELLFGTSQIVPKISDWLIFNNNPLPLEYQRVLRDIKMNQILK